MNHIDDVWEKMVNMNDEIENDEMLDEFEEIANKYYDMLLKMYYKEPYLNKSQNERFHNFLQGKLINIVEKTGTTSAPMFVLYSH